MPTSSHEQIPIRSDQSRSAAPQGMGRRLVAPDDVTLTGVKRSPEPFAFQTKRRRRWTLAHRVAHGITGLG